MPAEIPLQKPETCLLPPLQIVKLKIVVLLGKTRFLSFPAKKTHMRLSLTQILGPLISQRSFAAPIFIRLMMIVLILDYSACQVPGTLTSPSLPRQVDFLMPASSALSLPSISRRARLKLLIAAQERPA